MLTVDEIPASFLSPTVTATAVLIRQTSDYRSKHKAQYTSVGLIDVLQKQPFNEQIHVRLLGLLMCTVLCALIQRPLRPASVFSMITSRKVRSITIGLTLKMICKGISQNL